MSEELNLGNYKTFEPIDTPFGEQVKAENAEAGVSRLISHDELLRAHGHDPEKQQPPVDAIHHGEAHDIPVTIIGSYGLGDDKREYLKIEGSDTGIPRDELEFTSHEETDSPEELTEFSEYDLSSKALEIKEQLARDVDKEKARRKRLQDNEPLDSYERMLRRYLANEATIGGKELSDDDRNDLWLLSQRSEKKLQRAIEAYQNPEAGAPTDDAEVETVPVAGDAEQTAPAESPGEPQPVNAPDPKVEQKTGDYSETQDSDEHDLEPGQEGAYFSPTRGFENAIIKGFAERDGKKYIQLSHGEADKEEIEEVELDIYDAWQDEVLASGAHEVTEEDILDIASRRSRIWAKIQEKWKPEDKKSRKRKAKFALGVLAATNLVGQVGIVAYVFRKEWKRRHPSVKIEPEKDETALEESRL